jgi:predicted DNA-binding WGR domain protein
MENTGKSGGTSHNKFYKVEIRYNGKNYDIHTQWGPIGLKGQHKIHSTYTERYTATITAESIADSKKAKGYIVRQNKSVSSGKIESAVKNKTAIDIRLARFSFDEE